MNKFENDDYEITITDNEKIKIVLKSNNTKCDLNLKMGYFSVENKNGRREIYLEYETDYDEVKE